MSKIKNGGLDQFGTEPFEQQQFGDEGVKMTNATRRSISAVEKYSHESTTATK